jgi:F0F1-type ATP synthase assembly protein I
MLDILLRAFGVDLQQQFARLKAQADELKNQTIDEVKHQAVHTGVTIALTLLGLVFVLLTIVIGLIALYVWVEESQGPYAALGAVAATTSVMAALLFLIVSARGGKSVPSRPAVAPAPTVAPADAMPSAASLASLAETITDRLKQQTAEAASDAIDQAADYVRKSPREAILASLAAAIVIGLVIGRRK